MSDEVRPHAGVYLAHKPVGETSFSVVRGFHARLAATPGKALKVCHGGTLDPFAEGLLPILVGPATKLFELLHELPKTYVATVAWGAETDSDDGGGEVVRRASADQLSAAGLDAALAGFVGWREQVPPVMSNKRVAGERAHVVARRGEPVELAAVKVYLHAARWVSHELPTRSVLEVTCRGGFYVRSLARELGRAVGSAAHLVTLHRTQIGPWSDATTQRSSPVADAASDLGADAASGPAANAASDLGEGTASAPAVGGAADSDRLRHIADRRRASGPDVAPWLPLRSLTDDEWGHIRRGEPIARGALKSPPWRLPVGFPAPSPLIRAVHGERFLALLEERDGQLCTRLLLLPGLEQD